MTNPCKIIGISGGSGSGKTTLANALLEHYAGEADRPLSFLLHSRPKLGFSLLL